MCSYSSSMLLLPSIWRYSISSLVVLSSKRISSGAAAFRPRGVVSATGFVRPISTSSAASVAHHSHQKSRRRRSTSSFALRMASTTTNADGTTATTKLLWNRETCKFGNYNDDDDTNIVETARIVCLSDPDDPANVSLYGKNDDAPYKLGRHARVLQVAESTDELDIDMLNVEKCNVVYVSHPQAMQPLASVLQRVPTIRWIHSRNAGIDFCHSEILANSEAIMTNAKGQFSSTLAEYAMGAIAWFAKDFDRLRKNHQKKNWDKYSVLEIRGATLGIVGYGDIGRAAAKLAKAYGMKIIALRKYPENDDYADEVWHSDKLNDVFACSDYVLCAAPLTPETHKLIGKTQFGQHPRSGHQVFINLGRGPVVDEDALIEALQTKRLKGAALDVFAEEPLPVDSGLWDCDNLLLSPHNMDQTDTFMHESCEFFVREQVPRFVRGLPLYNPVDKVAGY